MYGSDFWSWQIILKNAHNILYNTGVERKWVQNTSPWQFYNRISVCVCVWMQLFYFFNVTLIEWDEGGVFLFLYVSVSKHSSEERRMYVCRWKIRNHKGKKNKKVKEKKHVKGRFRFLHARMQSCASRSGQANGHPNLCMVAYTY